MRIDFPAKEQIPQLWQLWQAAFGDSDVFIRHFFDTAFSCHRSRCAMDGENVAAALYWFDCECYGEKYAYLYAVATAESYRGQGLCHALMADTEKLLTARGYTGAILVPGDAGLSQMYTKMGYRFFGGREKVVSAAAAGELRRVDTARYAALRRSLLPRGGVIQEGENLAFLEGLADFYAGDSAVLAVAREDGEIIELLGNSRQADGAQPFAMCKLLKEGRLPEYFGFSFG